MSKQDTPMMIDPSRENESTPIACRLSARDLAARRAELSQRLFAHADAREELPDGFGFRFASAEPWAAIALEFILLERECCPFLRFQLAFEPDNGPFWFHLGGSAEIKAFVLTELGMAAD